jgi:hypothetical protein
VLAVLSIAIIAYARQSRPAALAVSVGWLLS